MVLCRGMQKCHLVRTHAIGVIDWLVTCAYFLPKMEIVRPEGRQPYISSHRFGSDLHELYNSYMPPNIQHIATQLVYIAS